MEPGWLHDALAGATLKALQDRKFDVGSLTDVLGTIPGAEDSPEPAVLLARIYAHIGHRLPFVKRIEKRLEGKDAKSGFGADVFALIFQLFLRNRDLLAALAKAYSDQKIAGRQTQTTTEVPS